MSSIEGFEIFSANFDRLAAILFIRLSLIILYNYI